MDVINSLDFSNETDYQNIYSSQLYGTFFMIYAKFHTETCEGGYKIKSIKLRLLNYKGPINIGILRAKLVTIIDDGVKYRTIKIEVQALAPSNCDFAVAIDEEIECPIGGYMIVLRSLKPLSSELVDSVFDSEFHYREGFRIETGDIIPDAVLRGPEPKNNYDDDSSKTESLNLIKATTGGLICPRSTNKVVR